jgi:undecaprenol kinase
VARILRTVIEGKPTPLSSIAPVCCNRRHFFVRRSCSAASRRNRRCQCYHVAVLAAANAQLMQTHKNQPFSTRLRFALAGIAHAYRTEQSLKTQMLALLLILVLLLICRPAPLWWALVISASASVLAAELFNTAIERLADHLHPELHPEIRIVKDCAAGAVLCVVIGAIGVAVALLVELTRR